MYTDFCMNPMTAMQVQDPVLGEIVRRLVWTREAWGSRIHLRTSLPATIAREGRLLYAA
jgi:hypothetical protein